MRRSPDRPLGVSPATVGDYRELARRRLPRQLFDYLDGGAYEEATMRANVADLERVLLRQRVMRDVSVREQAVEVLGQQLSTPIVLAPVGLAGMMAPRAEVQAARAAERAGVAFTESTVSICPIEEVAAATSRPPWFQLYVMRDRGYAEDLMARARGRGIAGAGADDRPGGRGRPPSRHPQRHGQELPLGPAAPRRWTSSVTRTGSARWRSAASRSPSATSRRPSPARAARAPSAPGWTPSSTRP